MRDDSIERMGYLIGVFLLTNLKVRLFQSTVYEAVFGIHECRFAVFFQFCLYVFGCFVAQLDYPFAVMKCLDKCLRALVVLK